MGPSFSLILMKEKNELTGSKTQIKCWLQIESFKIGDERNKKTLFNICATPHYSFM